MQPGTPTAKPFVNVADFGAVGDGSSDDTGALQAAIDAAGPSSSPTGGTVALPPGRYRLSASLVLPPAVSLVGAGWNTPGSQVNTFAGSWLFVPAGADWSPVVARGSGSGVRALAFNVPDQPSSANPPEAKPMVLVTGNNVLVEDVCLYNPFAGVFLDGGAQASLRRIWGQPLAYGIAVDRSQDTSYIDTVHFWPYWAPQSTVPGRYQLARGMAIALYRCDNPHLSNIFAYNYARGLSLLASPAGTAHKVHLVNADFDRCTTGVHVNAPGRPGSAATLQMLNVTVQSPVEEGVQQGHGVWVEKASSFAMVQALNLRISNSGLCGVSVEADNVNFYGENVSLEGFRGPVGFSVTSASSYAHLGIGFQASPAGGGRQPALGPRSQFRLAG
jgi:hypothetical protein